MLQLRKAGDPNRDSGSGTLLSGNSTITVSHSLGFTPTAVNVTPAGTDAALYVTNVTSTDFVVNRGGLSTGDVDFYWLVVA